MCIHIYIFQILKDPIAALVYRIVSGGHAVLSKCSEKCSCVKLVQAERDGKKIYILLKLNKYLHFTQPDLAPTSSSPDADMLLGSLVRLRLLIRANALLSNRYFSGVWNCVSEFAVVWDTSKHFLNLCFSNWLSTILFSPNRLGIWIKGMENLPIKWKVINIVVVWNTFIGDV